jgi:hypothetical protein
VMPFPAGELVVPPRPAGALVVMPLPAGELVVIPEPLGAAPRAPPAALVPPLAPPLDPPLGDVPEGLAGAAGFDPLELEPLPASAGLDRAIHINGRTSRSLAMQDFR